MTEPLYEIAIVGSGPGGLSAACRAAEMGDSYVLLEASAQVSNTIFRYQKGKHVMAEPGILPLRAAARFEAGRREAILDAWAADIARLGLNVRYHAQVSGIQKGDEHFVVRLSSGENVFARRVVLAIGVQGNPNKMKIAGEDLPGVQYQLDDPDEYSKEVIVVVGAGDAAIENAVALADNNTTHIVNRKAEFSRAKEGNNALILDAIQSGRVKCHYDSVPVSLAPLPAGHASGRRMLLKLNAKDGEIELPCDRIIARLGATPQRELVEACGISFPSQDPAAIPPVSATYESNVRGLHIIGALAGYPLIKQAMNQGYEVVEFIRGRPVAPADEPLLRGKFTAFSANPDVPAFLDVMAQRSPVLSAMNGLQLREFLLESAVYAAPSGSLLYTAGDYGSSVFIVVSGEAHLQADDADASARRVIKGGRILGEWELISGRPRSATATAGDNCVLIEVPRRVMLKLMAANASVRKYVDRVFTMRALERYLLPGLEEWQAKALLDVASLSHFKARDRIFASGDESGDIHLIRSGSVSLSTSVAGREVVLRYLAAGQYFGEMDVIAGTRRTQSAQAAVKTETIRIKAESFRELLAREPALREKIRGRFQEQIQQRLDMEKSPDRTARMQFLLQQGLGEATDALLIDEALCIRCDQCEKACASTHGNVSRLDREAGATFDNLHVPTSCRHCEHPHCMKDCPPDAIRRSPNGEVYIKDTCIGCGNCERNCPYGVIQMGVESDTKPSLWRWLVLGKGPAPGAEVHSYPKGSAKKAVKCDMCGGREAGPACVQACPTGAAIRIGPEQFFEILARGGR